MSGTGPIPAQPPRAMAQMFNVPMPLAQVIFNGFEHNFTASEFTSTLSLGPRPAVLLVMPPVVAKSFALSLLDMVKRYETATGTEIGTIEELTARITAYSEKGDEP
jgi:hypothetical protein